MKKTLQLLLILLFSAVFTAVIGQTIQYRSAPSGFSNNWSLASNWDKSTDTGSTWTHGVDAPDAVDIKVTIQAGHTITLDGSVSVQNLVVDGALVNSSSTLNGLFLYGNLSCSGTIGSLSDNIAISLDGSGTANTISGSGTIYLQYLTKINETSANTYTLSGDLTLTRGSNPFENLDGSTLTFTVSTGTLRIPNATSLTTASTITFDFSNASSSVVYSKSGNQTIWATTYGGRLELEGSGTKTLSSAATVSGTLSIGGTASFSGGSNLTWSSGTLEYAGSSAQTFSSEEWNSSPTNLTINNPNGVAANASKTVSGTLTVNAGSDFNNGTYTFGAKSIANSGAISGTGLITITGGTGATLTGSGTFENLAITGDCTNSGSPTVNQSFYLTSGTFTNSGAMNFASGVQITRTSGSWAGAGTTSYAGSVDVIYGATVTSGGELPSSATALNDLTINSSFTVTLGANATVNGTVTLNGNLDVSTNTLTIKNPFAGILANLTCSSGTLYVDGTAKATIYIPAITYSGLTIDRSGGVYMSGDATVTTLTFTNGNLYTGSYALTLASGFTVTGEADGSYLVGTLKTTAADTPAYNAFASLGLQIGTSGTISGTGVVLTRTTGSGAAVTVSGNSGFDRVYTLTGSGLGHTSTVTCDWFASESSGRNTSNVAIWEYTDGTGSWTSMGPDGAATGSYTTTSSTASNISGASTIKYTITDDANPLPVELTSFTASVDDRTVTLNWETATEVDNYGFEIERNLVVDGQDANWETLGFVQGAGNSNSPKEYSFVDESVFFGKYQYRLKQIDTDGKYEYFDVIEVQVGEIPTEYSLRQNYPNPFNPSTVIEFGLPESTNITLSVYNLLGEKVATLFSGNMEAGIHKVDFNASNLSSGIYIYSLEGQSVRITKKMMLMK